MLNVKVKKLHPNAKIPTYAKIGDAGMDLVAVSQTEGTNGFVEFRTGLSFEIPEGYVGLVFPRSSISNVNMMLANCVGVIDSGYRGEVTVRFKPDTSSIFMNIIENQTGERLGDLKHYEVGDKVAQLIILPYPHIEFIESDELSETERGNGGYGSSGK